LKIYSFNTKKIEESYGAMRRFKHDYLNILTTLELFIKEGDLQGLKEYYLTNFVCQARTCRHRYKTGVVKQDWEYGAEEPGFIKINL